jgi:hypothetical protein
MLLGRFSQRRRRAADMHSPCLQTLLPAGYVPNAGSAEHVMVRHYLNVLCRLLLDRCT